MTENKIITANNNMIKFACENWHYSKSVPCGRKVAYAIFEENKFIGVIIYSLGANNNMPKSFNLLAGEAVELTRIALNNHKNPVSRYLSITLKMLKQQCKTIKLVVSYADLGNQNHYGGIYQATNWLYLGTIKPNDLQYFYKGKWTHQRTLNALAKTYGKKTVSELGKTLQTRKNGIKHKYIYCFDKELENKYRKIAKKYPKKDLCVGLKEGAIQCANGGVIPTPTIHLDNKKEVAYA